MTQLALSPRAYGRPRMGLPQARLVNMFVEETPHGPTADARFPRPGLQASYSVGTGPIRGMFSQPGVFGGALFIVSGQGMYLADGTSLGTIPGSDTVRFAASPEQVVAVGGGTAFLHEGAGFNPITDTDLPAVSDVARLAGRFVYAVAGSDRFYWSEINDAGNIDGLSFATAEGSADANLGVATLGDELNFFGASTVEVWFASGDPDAPFQKALGRQYSRGCAARDSVAALDNALFFLGEDRIVYRAQQAPIRISTFSLEERLKSCSAIGQVTALAISLEGHSFYLLNIPGQGSFAFDIASGQWAEWASWGRDVFRGRCVVSAGGETFVGDDETGTVWKLAPGVYRDGTDPISFIASCFMPMPGGSARCDNLVLQGARGVGLASGQGVDPQVEMRWSDDQGRTWSRWRAAPMGALGEYRRRAVWQRLGTIREPGRAFEFRATDPVLATLSGVLLNVSRPHG
jgi:hypothetical protein